MKASEVVDRLTTRVPESDSWTLEPYGAFFVEGNLKVNKVLYCVTPTKGVLTYFEQNKYDLLVSHHPYIAGVPQVILHTALDCCPGGMNDQWRDVVGIKNAKHFDKNMGWSGEIEPILFNKLVKKVADFVGEPIGWTHCDLDNKGNNIIESVVVCSGLGGLVENQAYGTKADCYVTGQLVYNPAYSQFRALIETGHTISESKPGYNLVKATLSDIQVDCASMDIDVFGVEYYGGKRR